MSRGIKGLGQADLTLKLIPLNNCRGKEGKACVVLVCSISTGDIDVLVVQYARSSYNRGTYPPIKKPPRKVYRYQKGDYESMRSDALRFSKERYFSGYSDSRSVQENFNLVTSFIQDSADKHIPSGIRPQLTPLNG